MFSIIKFANDFIKEHKEFSIYVLSSKECKLRMKKFNITLASANSTMIRSRSSIDAKVILATGVAERPSYFTISHSFMGTVYGDKVTQDIIYKWVEDSYDILKKHGIADQL